jgi:uncharacterized membrane protein YbhN (UPF0104 family)
MTRTQRGRTSPRRLVETVASGVLAAALLIWGLPHVAGADWSDIRRVLAHLTLAQLALLAVVWQLGLWVHTIALAAAMPGLSHPRAYFLNLTGSAVSDLLPFGGAAGTALNYSTCRVWGFSTPAFLRWAIVTNIWDTLGKLVIPGIALLWLAVDQTHSPGTLASAALGSVALLAVLVLLTWHAVRYDVIARSVGRAMDWVVSHLRRPGVRQRTTGGPGGSGPYAVQAVVFRRESAALIGAAWWRLTVGKAGYAACQALLLWLCLRVLGAEVSPAVAFAAFAAERVLSLAVLTPGATGVVEVGMTGMLVAFGVAPATAAASVLLYRAFIVGMEIPSGGGAMAWWLLRRRATRVSAPRGNA